MSRGSSPLPDGPAHLVFSIQHDILQNIADASPEGMLVATAYSDDILDVSIEYVNVPFEQQTGLRAEDLLGQPLHLLESLSAPDSNLNILWIGIVQRRSMRQQWRCISQHGIEWSAEVSLAFIDVDTTVKRCLLTFRTLSNHAPAFDFDAAGMQAAQAALTKQVDERTAMLFQTMQSLQRQVSERQRVEVEIRQRLKLEQMLGAMASRLEGEWRFDHAAGATVADIGTALAADHVALYLRHSSGVYFSPSHWWSPHPANHPANHSTVRHDIAARAIPDLLKSLHQAGFCLLADDTRFKGERAEIPLLEAWRDKAVLVLPIYSTEELGGLLFVIADGTVDTDENRQFTQAAAGILSGLLRIDKMMKALEQRVAQQSEELSAFFNMAVLASSSERLTETLAEALNLMMETSDCDAICAHIMNGDMNGGGNVLELAYQIGMDQIEHAHLQRVDADSPVYKRIHRTHTPIFATKSSSKQFSLHLPEFNTYFGTRMVIRTNIHGLLSFYWRGTQTISINQMSVLTALSDQLGVILDNQKLHRRAQEVGGILERQRLARELHDSVTQSMYSVMLFASAGREALQDTDFERLAYCLEQVEESSQRSLKEMRLLLYQLRPVSLEELGIAEAIKARVDVVERRLGMRVDLMLAPLTMLSSRVEEGLYFVAMEALNNVLKHANARRVEIRLSVVEQQAQLTIRDDGIGFLCDEVNHGMGLTNMRDRIAALAGHIEIRSELHHGALVHVRVPLD